MDHEKTKRTILPDFTWKTEKAVLPKTGNLKYAKGKAKQSTCPVIP